MDIFDFEELVSEMLDVNDEEREELPDIFYATFDIDFDNAFEFVKRLILHTPPVTAGLTGKSYHAFISRNTPVILMKVEK